MYSSTIYVYRLPFCLLVSGMVAKYRLKLFTIELVKAVHYATGIVPQVGLFVCLSDIFQSNFALFNKIVFKSELIIITPSIIIAEFRILSIFWLSLFGIHDIAQHRLGSYLIVDNANCESIRCWLLWMVYILLLIHVYG